MPNSPSDPAPLLVFGAHPDDIEFGAGGIVAAEARRGRPVHLVVCSRGESGTNGTPEIRTQEAETAAATLGATLEWLDLGGDANIENTREGARTLAAIIRRVRPETVLTLTVEEDQHPDHVAVGRMTRDAARLARYGGVKQLADQPRHAIKRLLFYAVSPDAAPVGRPPVLYALTDEDVAIWREAMAAHASQMKTRDYGSLQITRASLLGQNAGGSHAIALYPNEPLVFTDLDALGGGSRHF
ncbi:PIG-L deacetylase family protein [Actomonas aquatica]|uniref:PIG-L family deacetylase n=1 Tax=Actomonas aquatica TaxID=2866162 RepID=A0ABZ1CAR1_9BACT|nr:PIG-L family deacetylase [Opitutus sp. WL0086]WRQ88684.1 PIG-L family deacetylase [Opitutus sp. WL0086]